MGKITKIEKQVKHSERYNIFIDDTFAFGVMENTLLHFQLFQDKHIDETLTQHILKYDYFQKLYYKAVIYISYTLRSEYEVREKLNRAFNNEDSDYITTNKDKIITLVIKQLKKDGYIDDRYYVQAYIAQTLEVTLKGPRAIYSQLIKKGIDQALITEQLQTISHIQLEQIALSLGQQYVDKQKQYSLLKTKQKTAHYLHQRGFTTQTIDSIMQQLDFSTIINQQNDVLANDFSQLKQKYNKRFTGYDFKQKVIQALLSKGHAYANIQQLFQSKK